MNNMYLKKIVTLVLTQNCNLNCSYCYEHSKTKKTMSVETAKKIIEKEINTNDEYPEIIFEFFGGEPFLEFDLIKELYEYIWNPKFTKKRVCFVSTNGTLLTDKMKEWLSQRKQYIVCGLSVDGTKKMHNINRSKSFDSIDLDFFVNTWPEQSAKMTISKETINDLAEGIIFLHNKRFLISANLAHGVDWSEPNLSDILEEQLNKLIEFYVDNPDIQPCSMMSMPISRLASNDINKRWCGSGTHMKAYDIDGQCYPCQMFLPISSTESRNFESINFSDDEKFKDPFCNNCPIDAICPNCYGMNYNNRGNVAIRDHNLCVLTKIIALAVSKMQYLKIQRYGIESISKEPLEQYKVVKGIEIIQKQLSYF